MSTEVIWFRSTSQPGLHVHEYKIENGVVYSRNLSHPQWETTFYSHKLISETEAELIAADFTIPLAVLPEGKSVITKRRRA